MALAISNIPNLAIARRASADAWAVCRNVAYPPVTAKTFTYHRKKGNGCLSIAVALWCNLKS